MVGALARLTLHGEMIGGRARDARQALGLQVPSTNVVANSVAQFVELVDGVERALAIVTRLIRERFTEPAAVEWQPRAGEGTAASEVPRGILFHHYRLDEQGRVAAADVVTPTAENCASLEDQLRATVRDGTGETDDELRRRLEVVVRAFDPCVSCSVHAVRGVSRQSVV
jgi:sulfhydrogenase subunit alpha